jgi:hypothetical protein
VPRRRRCILYVACLYEVLRSTPASWTDPQRSRTRACARHTAAFRWEKEGAHGWSYADCLPYFQKAQVGRQRTARRARDADSGYPVPSASGAATVCTRRAVRASASVACLHRCRPRPTTSEADAVISRLDEQSAAWAVVAVGRCGVVGARARRRRVPRRDWAAKSDSRQGAPIGDGTDGSYARRDMGVCVLRGTGW